MNIYPSGTTLQVTFSSDAPVIITIHSSSKPVMVYADSTPLTEDTSTTGLTVASNAWVYQGQAVTVYADPSSITLFYQTPSAAAPQSPPSAGMPATTLLALCVGVLVVIGIAAVVVIGRRKKSI